MLGWATDLGTPCLAGIWGSAAQAWVGPRRALVGESRMWDSEKVPSERIKG